MMKKLLIVFAPLLLISCATLMPEMVPAPEVVHEHKLTITDLKGNPLAGAKVSFLEKNNDEIVLNSSTTTAADGVVFVRINATSDRKYPSILAYKTTVNYNVEKEGFYKAAAFTFVAKSGQKSESTPLVQSDTKTLKLIRPTDFFFGKLFGLSSIECVAS
ncbi:MAG: hypothetical protein M0042_12920 [Nitrospiraceae bacterium]|nr:hypothetical protein [Nitrospiraceae bacterium]